MPRPSGRTWLRTTVIQATTKRVIGENEAWRRRRDSNPRDPHGPNGFQDRRIQPLCHSSTLIINNLLKVCRSSVAHLVGLHMQRGHFYRPIGARHLRYRNGKQVSVKLADYTDEYRTLKSVRPLGEPYLQLANLESKCVSARLERKYPNCDLVQTRHGSCP